MKAQMLYQTTNITGEGVTWLQNMQKLLWVDIEGKTLYEMNAVSNQVKTHHFSNMLSTIYPIQSNNQVVILALENQLVTYNPSTKELNTILHIPIEKELRTNDGKASPDGRIWLGAMHLNNHHETGYLYRIDHNLSITKVLEQQSIPNGMVWDRAGEFFYYADSGKSTITRYKYNKISGEISNPKIIIKVPNEYGVPDGMTIDEEGRLWVAHWGGYGVYVWNVKTGQLEEKIEVPVPNVASCTFGGKDMSTLYITTATAGLQNEELRKYPLSGSLFSVETKSKGGINHYPFIPSIKMKSL